MEKTHYIVGYQVDEETITPLVIKTPKDMLSYGVSRYDKSFTYLMSFNVSEAKEWVFKYKKIWNEVESQLFEKLATGSIKSEAKYIYGKTAIRPLFMAKIFHTTGIAMQRQF